jgi:hypothetical protein
MNSAAGGLLEQADACTPSPSPPRPCSTGSGVIRAARADERDERLAGARLVRMQEARERLAPRAGLADQQHRGHRAGDLLDLARAAACMCCSCRPARPRPAPSSLHRGARLLAAGLERALDGAQQLGERQRLLDEIEGAEARGLDRRLDGAVARHHHDRAGPSVGLGPLAQQRDAVGVGHPDVEQHEVRRVARASLLRAWQRPPRPRPRSLRPTGSPAAGPRISASSSTTRMRAALMPAPSATPNVRSRCQQGSTRGDPSAATITRTRAPPSRRLSASMRPPCSSTIFLTMARPSPVPRACW